MATLTIAGDYTSALTHFALYGLSLMVEQKHPGTVTVGCLRRVNRAPRCMLKACQKKKLPSACTPTFLPWLLTVAG